MEIYAKEFCLPKNGNTEAENDDSFSSAKDKSRFAVADGATEASFSRQWAKQLVRAFTTNKLSIPIALDELKPLQSRWEQFVHRHPLPWYAEEKASRGAFAAFVGLEFLEEKKWRATAAGDSCLVQVRGDEIVKAFPLTDSASFGCQGSNQNQPAKIESKPASLRRGIHIGLLVFTQVVSSQINRAGSASSSLSSRCLRSRVLGLWVVGR